MTPEQTFHDHIRELRRRILWVVLAIGLSAGVAYALRKPLIRVLQHPLGTPLFYSSPAGSFNFVMKLSMMIGVFIALPLIVYHLIRFIEPALPVRIKKLFIAKIIGASFLLAVAGALFGFFVMIPMSLKFFAGYSSAQIKPLISANEYLSYVTSNITIFALVFQIPLIVLFINWIKPIKPGKFLRYQRHVVVGSFALAVVLPFTYDPISQFIVAIPIVVLYYLSAILLLIANRHRKEKPDNLVVTPQPEPEPAPIASIPAPTPIPIPVLQAEPQQRPTPLVPVRARSRAIDGFISAPRRTIVTSRRAMVKPLPVNRALPKAPTKVIDVNRSNPKLSIDGISPGFGIGAYS